ncbi:uncharacterized protein LOC103868271 [Brassica rapa]|uniref:uncharacterized protein LOC103868271 n=1 Tax=Brassica campestris TaxID=3711 RepID=UPI0004F1544D|nr:uncharacterized protein LOC103868271 [Brassica rapa]
MPARPLALVLHQNMRVIDFINQKSKEWDVRLLEDYVAPADILFIRSFAISSTHRRDTFCWNYTKNGQYTVKSGYWVPQNLLKYEEEKKMGHGKPLHSSAVVDGFGWIAWKKFNLWGYKIIQDESMPYIQKRKHYDGRWRVCILHVKASGHIARI